MGSEKFLPYDDDESTLRSIMASQLPKGVEFFDYCFIFRPHPVFDFPGCSNTAALLSVLDKRSCIAYLRRICKYRQTKITPDANTFVSSFSFQLHHSDLKSALLSPDTAEIPSFYGVKFLIEKLRVGDLTEDDFLYHVRTVFLRTLRRCGVDMSFRVADDQRIVVKARIRETHCRKLADHLQYKLKLQNEEIVAPYAPFNVVSESTTHGFYTARTEKSIVWTRYNALNESQPKPVNTGEVNGTVIEDMYPQIRCFSIFRDIDRIRILTYLFNLHFDTVALCNGSISAGKKISPLLLDHFPLAKTQIENQIVEYGFFNHAQPAPNLIRDYFGEEIAFYFLWTNFFNAKLKQPAFIGTAVYILQLILQRQTGGRFSSVS